MINNLHRIPFLLIAFIVLSGVVIYFVFFLLSKYSIAFTERKKDHSYIIRFIPRIKLIVWLLWFVVSLYYLLLVSHIITIIFLIGLYLFSKDFWKDIYSGVFLKYNDKVKVGDYIFVSSIKEGGVISKLLLSDIELEKENNEYLYIPYSLIINSPILKRNKIGNHFLNDFVLDNSNQVFNKKYIEEALINCPWTILSKPIIIDIDNSGKFRIRTYTFSKDTALQQIECVKNMVNK